MHHVMFIAICLIWGSNFILMKWASAGFGPIGVAAGRVLGGAVVLSFFWVIADKATRGGPHTTSRRQWLALMVPVVIGSISPYVIQPYLIGKHQESAFFGMMVVLVPLLTIVASVPMLRVLPSVRQSAGVLLGLVCMAMLFRDGGLRGVSAGDLVLAVMVPASYAVSNTFIKRNLSDMPPLYMTAMILVLTSFVLTPIGVGVEGIKDVGSDTLVPSLAALCWLGVIGTGVATVWFYRLVQSHGPLYAGMVTYIVPLGAVAWGWFDDEHISAAQLVALIGVLSAVAMVQRGAKATQPVPVTERA